MVLDTIIARLNKALTHLHPRKVGIEDYTEMDKSKSEILLRVVTDNFKDIRNKTRDRMVREMLSKEDPELYDAFNIACQCFTEKEYKLFQMGEYWNH